MLQYILLFNEQKHEIVLEAQRRVSLRSITRVLVDGFAPVIINITPLPSVLPLLGLEPKKEEYELSQLN